MRNIFVVLAVVCFVHGHAHGQSASCHFVEKANVSIAVPLDEQSEPVAALLKVHEVQAGSKHVLLFRGFRPIQGVMDADTYWKLTVAIGEPIGASKVLLDAKQVALRFSSGGSSWVHKGYGYMAANGTGFLRLRRLAVDRLVGDIDVEVIAQRVEDPSEAISYQIRGTYEARILDRHELTLWQGSKIGTNVRAEDAARPSLADQDPSEWQSRCEVALSRTKKVLDTD